MNSEYCGGSGQTISDSRERTLTTTFCGWCGRRCRVTKDGRRGKHLTPTAAKQARKDAKSKWRS